MAAERAGIRAEIMEVPGVPGFREMVENAAARLLPEELNSEKYFIFPGFCDVHVHLREPGFSYKETIATGTKAAAHGGWSWRTAKK